MRVFQESEGGGNGIRKQRIAIPEGARNGRLAWKEGTMVTGASVIWTIGHSSRSIDDFLFLLRENSIRIVADVRSWPRSRRHPHFDGGALRASLGNAGIAYRHFPGLGGRRKPSMPAGTSPNGFWKVEGFRNYADHALSRQFGQALAELMECAAAAATAMLCAEADPDQCHRRIIGDHLMARGWRVLHILGPADLREARMNDAARISPNGTVTYPPIQTELFPEGPV